VTNKTDKLGRASVIIVDYLTTLLTSLVLIASFLVVEANSQNIQDTAGNTNSATSIDSEVDPSSLGLNLRLTLTNNPGRKGIDLPAILQYSSKVWHLQYVGAYDRFPEMPGVESTITEAQFTHGWTTNLDPPTLIDVGATYDHVGRSFDIGWLMKDEQPPDSWFIVPRLSVKMPDGSTHELRKGDWMYERWHNGPVPPWVYNGVYYALDSSRIRYDTASRTLHLPDGSRYIHEINQNAFTQFIDRNGNKVSLGYANNRWMWTDTVGRSVNLPQFGVLTPQDTTYSVTGINNTAINYVMKWRNLSDVRTDPLEPLRYVGDCAYASQTAASFSPSLFNSSMVSDYVRNWNEVPYDPVVLNEISFPNGTSYKFTYNVWGEIDKIVYPSGGYERFRYDSVQGTSWAGSPYNEANRGVVERWISADGTSASEERWRYAASMGGGYGALFQVVSETAPDNTRTERHFHAGDGMSFLGVENMKTGLLAEERVYDSNGTMVRRRMKDYQLTGFISQRPFGTYPLSAANRDPRTIREVEILLDPGASSYLATTKSFQYDSDLNMRFAWEFSFAEILNRQDAETLPINSLPQGNLTRTTEYTYLSGGAYANLIGLVASMRITDELGRLSELTEYEFDEGTRQSYSGELVGWTDPQTNARGNVTTMKRWIDATTFVETHSTYDIFGNEVSATDGLARSVMFEFSSANKYAYQTRVIVPPADPTGVTGSSSQSDYQTSFDFWTGSILSTTDVNSQVTTYAHVDPMDRLTLVTRPDGGWLSFQYGDTPNNFFLRVTSAQDSTQVIEKYEYYDGLMRPRRKSDNEGGTWRVVDVQYDNLGRQRLVSNPYRNATPDGPPNPPGLWTTNQFDVLGRVINATGPDGGVVVTSYANNTVLITDQANRQVRSIADTRGQITQVIEAPNSAAPLVTNYVYDAANNLRTVSQQSVELGVTQKRHFMHDLLGRLVRVKHPEHDAKLSLNFYDEITGNSDWSMQFEYDKEDNLKMTKDARGVVVDYDYDTYDRVTKRTFSVPGGVSATPTVDYLYDGAGVPGGIPFSRGNRTKVTSSVATISADEFDLMGRIKQTTQSLDGQSYTMRYDFDFAGHVIAQTYPSGRVVRNSFDRAERLTEISGQKPGEPTPKVYASQISYAPHWGTSSYKLGNNLYGQVTYNDTLQRTHVKLGTSVGDSSVFKLENFYTAPSIGNNGNLRKQIITAPGLSNTQEFTYDPYDRLEEAKENSGGSWRQKFLYDRFGNKRIDTTVTTPGMVGTNPLVDASTNRLQGYGYDSAGNMVSDPQGHAYDYDANNLLSVFDHGTAAYAYDGNDRRVKKTFLGVSTYYVYNLGGQLIAEYTTGPQTQGGTSYLTGDHTGTPRVITDHLGGVKERHDYLPFGEEVPTGFGGRSQDFKYGIPSSIKQKYTGVERDEETKLDYFGARYYASSVGRFISTDPLQASAVITDPQTWNRYAYVTNNPLKYVDIGGLLKRNKDGTLKIERTGQTGTATHKDDPNTHFKIEIIYVQTDGGKRVQGFISLEATDSRHDTDCHGLTFAEGQVWINDEEVPKIMDSKKGDGYSETTTPAVGDVIVYYDVDSKNRAKVVHSATITAVDAQGNVTAVSGLGGIDPESATTAPANGFRAAPEKGTTRQTKYFHSNNRTDEERKSNAERAKTHNKAQARVKKKEEAEKKKAAEKEQKERRKREKKERKKPKSGDASRENDNGAEPGVEHNN
jgi:RHS repeat-associated protein